MSQSVTLDDVAKLAGVSIGTASQSLNNRPNVASETRARVIDAARTLGYPTKQERYPDLSVPVKVIGLLVPLRVSEPHEIEGLDLTQHGEALQ